MVASELNIRNVKTHIEVLRHVPLRPGTNLPDSSSCRSHLLRPPRYILGRCPRLRTKDVIGLAVVTHRRIATVERRSPPRGPEVLVARVDSPRRGQLDASRGDLGPA